MVAEFDRGIHNQRNASQPIIARGRGGKQKVLGHGRLTSAPIQLYGVMVLANT
ncbi:hypothetical protein TG4357_01881 [Thalassovita gelatinovora]|uniref:Uncharacterized protein n=1 Tax=Thalassovita gelatinovora TaxID=53501 RepID=A0A0P1FBN1_THAGE|nr:hypothetical protein [Thalassovita gelatinovora]QIZ80061.1 hypothetical protein HFZ77_06025 [Thalassovita gelatinovora]CUH65469.1 hypothetical protein TG4357_01881 [Thalassovita gelatinovora]SER09161.1 hypothetical protein SAMN04488043_11569 [Thalassovita gelatinovora]